MATKPVGHLYAVLFSTGLIKVGKAVDPMQRIGEHERRLACAGVTVVDRRHAQCVGDYSLAERALIAQCSGAASATHCAEWFDGLCFEEVIQWMNSECSSERHVVAPTSPGRSKTTGLIEWPDLKAWLRGLGLTQTEMAKQSGVPQPTLCLLLQDDGPHRSATPRLATYLKLLAFYEAAQKAEA